MRVLCVCFVCVFCVCVCVCVFVCVCCVCVCVCVRVHSCMYKNFLHFIAIILTHYLYPKYFSRKPNFLICSNIHQIYCMHPVKTNKCTSKERLSRDWHRIGNIYCCKIKNGTTAQIATCLCEHCSVLYFLARRTSGRPSTHRPVRLDVFTDNEAHFRCAHKRLV